MKSQRTHVVKCSVLAGLATGVMSIPVYGQSLDVFPALPDVVAAADAPSVSTRFSSSGSAWSLPYGEEQVFLATLSSAPKSDGSAWPWDVRIGKGGQIYSIRSNFGEAIPPQWRAAGVRQAPWMDEVFQVVAVPSKKHTREVPFFIHQAGVYLTDPILTAPFHSPLLKSAASEDGRSFSTLTWGQLSGAQPDTPNRSRLLIYQKTTNLGDGVICVDNVLYNFGPETFDHLNLPWGGTRATNLGTHLIAQPDGGWRKDDIDFGSNTRVPLKETAGWMAFAAGDAGDSAALSLVFGTQENGKWRFGNARHGARPGAGETEWRNYLVGTTIRSDAVKPGTSIASRYFLVVGTLAQARQQIDKRGLAAKAGVQITPRPAAEAPVVAVGFDARNKQITLGGNDAAGKFYLLAEPADGSKPLFDLTLADGTHVYSLDPYAVSAKPYDGRVKSFAIVGFVPLRSALPQSHAAAAKSLPEAFAGFGDAFHTTDDDVALLTSPLK